jgi:hypothetical protein
MGHAGEDDGLAVAIGKLVEKLNRSCSVAMPSYSLRTKSIVRAQYEHAFAFQQVEDSLAALCGSESGAPDFLPSIAEGPAFSSLSRWRTHAKRRVAGDSPAFCTAHSFAKIHT